jgi:hypothetical protein
MSEFGGDLRRPVEGYHGPPESYEPLESDELFEPAALWRGGLDRPEWSDDGDIGDIDDNQPPAPVPLDLARLVATPAVKAALRGFVTDDQGADTAFRAVLRDQPGPAGGLVDALIRDGGLRSSLASAVRGGPDSRETRWFLVRYLVASGRSAELDRLDGDPDKSSPVADVTCLFAGDEVKAIAQLHDEWAATSEATLRYRRDEADGGAHVRDEPKPLPVWLDVVAPAHGQITTAGVSRHFRAHTVHAQASTAVADANDCHWRTSDHYHVHRMTMSVEPLMDDDRAWAALTRLVEDPSDTGRLRDFQRALRGLVAPPEDEPTRIRVPVEPTHHTEVVGADVVQTGHGSSLTIRSRYVIEETELPFVAMLADDRDLVRRFVAVFADGGEQAMRPFLRAVAGSAGRIPDLDVISGASGLPREDTLLSCLFGVARVEDASAVMIGTGNRLDVAVRVERPGLDRGDLRTNLEKMRVHWEEPPAAHEVAKPVEPPAPINLFDDPPPAGREFGL